MNRQTWKAIVLLCVCPALMGCLGGAMIVSTRMPSKTAIASMETFSPSKEPTSRPVLTLSGTTPTFTVASPSTTIAVTLVPPTPTAILPAQFPNTSSMSPTGEPYYEDRTGPTSLLASYYNAINRREYARAWAYWESPPNSSYEDFVQGFTDTTSVLLAVHPPTWFEGAAGSTYASMPALLSATRADGSQHNFVGCFVARCFNVGENDDEQEWSLYEATIRSTPDNSAKVIMLVGACDPLPETKYDDQSNPVNLLTSYYNAINFREYSRAWAYWGTPPSSSFGEFAEGFTGTESVMLIVSPPTHSTGAADSLYVAIPAFLSAVHKDGIQQSFVGCFIARQSKVGGPGIEQEWYLFDATILLTTSNTTDVAVLDQVCATR